MKFLTACVLIHSKDLMKTLFKLFCYIEQYNKWFRVVFFTTIKKVCIILSSFLQLRIKLSWAFCSLENRSNVKHWLPSLIKLPLVEDFRVPVLLAVTKHLESQTSVSFFFNAVNQRLVFDGSCFSDTLHRSQTYPFTGRSAFCAGFFLLFHSTKPKCGIILICRKVSLHGNFILH